MNYVVMDLESTCWEKRTTPDDQEVIEIGAVKLGESLEIVDDYNRFIKPLINNQLSEFCQDLTHIGQSDIAVADSFDVVFSEFLDWIGKGAYRVVTWGEYDIKQLQIECKRHKMKLPIRFIENHINLKKLFAQQRRIRPCGMAQALKIMNMKISGTHHRGIDDAKNIAMIFKAIFSKSKIK